PLTDNQVSLWIAPTDNPTTPIVDYHSEIPRTPASVMKVITTGTGLLLLGADYRWKTEFYTDGSINNGTLNGNLIIKGYGDPYMVEENMADIVSALKINGLSHINGKVILDNNYFQHSDENPDAFDGHGFEPYNAIPNALSINFRTITLNFTVKNKQIHISSDPQLSYTHIKNEMRFNRQKRCRGRRAFTPKIKLDKAQGLIIVSGTMSRNCKEQKISKVLTDAGDLYFGHFRRAWQEQGGTISGTWVYGQVPSTATLFYQYQSHLPLSEQIAAMNKKSNNIMTRQLFLTIGAEKMQAPATLDKSRQVVKQQLNQLGVDTQDLFVDNGSGLSRMASISAKQLGQFLLAMHRSPASHTFEQSLSVAGVDGTLRKRLRNTPLAGNIIGKSGTLKKVKSLAGYMHSQSGKKYIYVMLFEGKNARAGRLLMDNILQWVYTQ
ncbi:MAG: D-alanyl-D-alanine carboxypeptidase/D-alanyl-D-alanine-endopeptidase, partial [Gammaproteobacteria bacterium]|nr:D-alanyl-D-alanine carboxypeptidase/D-alanyl-D-alanine-endopeptidase [Gammaproteobacteria bacterium]